MTRSLSAVESLLAARLGLDVSSLSPDATKRAVERRSLALGLDGPARYLGRLLDDPSEWVALVEEVVVPETWLFRDGGPFDELAAFVRSRAGSPSARSIRILSLPCASGEEAWSVATILAETGVSPREATVDAVDVSPRLVEAARRGIYGSGAIRDLEALPRTEAFRPVEGGLEIRPALRPYVRFHVGNALEYEAPAPPPCYDVVFCRNLLIYLTPEARRRVTNRIDGMLRPGGLLVLGHAEAFSTFFPSYAPVPRPRSFAARKPEAVGEPARPRVPARPAQRPGSVPAASGSRPAAERNHGRHRPPPPAAPAGEELLVLARRLAGAGERASVERLCAEALAADPVSVEAYLLLAETALAAGDERRAEARFDRVLYLDPRHEGALLQLARLRERAGDGDAAGRLRGRAVRAARAIP
ncbi:MAG: protein-glutamate O-methyltransferase CheR [Holophagales bacterium]|nr:protein-glutamate O-methyltransferase CheR [Holophagales bacterium]